MAIKKNKILRSKFNQGGENLYTENYTTLLKETTKAQINRNLFHCEGEKNILFPLPVRGSILTETPTLARHHSNYLHALFYDRRSW